MDHKEADPHPNALVARLRQALDEAERLARQADWTPGSRWRAETTGPYGPRVVVGNPANGEWSREVNVQIWACEDEEDGCPEVARSWKAEAKHIARWDPVAVLRMLAAHRGIIDAHSHPDPCPTILALAKIYTTGGD